MSFAVADVVDQFHYLRWRKISQKRGWNNNVQCPQGSRKPRLHRKTGRRTSISGREYRAIRLSICLECANHRGVEDGYVLCLTDIRWQWSEETVKEEPRQILEM